MSKDETVLKKKKEKTPLEYRPLSNLVGVCKILTCRLHYPFNAGMSNTTAVWDGRKSINSEQTNQF